MKRLSIAVVLLASAVTVASQQKVKNVYKLTHVSTTDAILTCQNGNVPTFKQLTNNAIMVSCGQ